MPISAPLFISTIYIFLTWQCQFFSETNGSFSHAYGNAPSVSKRYFMVISR
jgi:hypothetical protein